jgi:arylsulfatase
MMRRIKKSGAVWIAAMAMLAALVAGAPLDAAEDPRPNFVLFIGDDISQADFGCYGHPTIQTPHVDALAAGGFRFTNAYLTTSSCSPTRTSIITGRYPHNTGAPELHQMNSPHLGELPQFPHELRKAGYYTAQAGKWHFNGNATKSFDHRAKEGGHSGADQWIEILKNRPTDKPFFMWFAANDAHRDWDMDLSQGPQTPDTVRVPPYMVDTPATREDLTYYENEVHRFDANIGLVVAELKRQGQHENTVFIVSADNGRPFPRDKTWLYDGGIETPLVIHWPAKLKKPAVVDALVSVIDLPPTILKLAGLSPPQSFQGVSLEPILNNPAASVRDFVFAERNWHSQRHHERLVRHGDYVYIRNNLPELRGINFIHLARDRGAYTEVANVWRGGHATPLQADIFREPRPRHMLFYVAEDRYQCNDLASDLDHADTLALLQKTLDQWTDDTGDTLPALDDMTQDRFSRETWKPKGGGGRSNPGEVPGQSTRAWTIHNPGPIHLSDLKDSPSGP